MTPTAQCFFTGHLEHSGALGEQIVAPSSITAWLKSPGRVGDTILLALLQKALLSMVKVMTIVEFVKFAMQKTKEKGKMWQEKQ